VKYVVVVELRGFTNISEALSHELEAIKVDAAVIRTSIIKTVSKLVEEIVAQKPDIRPDFQSILGGDTWGFVFSSFGKSIEFACTLLNVLANNAHEYGLFHIKPSVAIDCIDRIKVVDSKMIDDGFISAYRLADRGKSYTLFVGEELYKQSIKEIDEYSTYISRDIGKGEGDETIGSGKLIFDWKRFDVKSKTVLTPRLSYLDIFFDATIMNLDTLEKTVANFIHAQNMVQNIHIYGGIIDPSIEVYDKYLKSIISLFREKEIKCTVLNYAKLSNKKSGYITVSIFHEIMKRYPSKLAYGLQIVPEDMLDPNPFHIYGNEFAQFIMRSYSPHIGAYSAISSFVIKNQKICDLYTNEFVENFKKAGKMTDLHYDQYVVMLKLSSTERKEYDEIIMEYMEGEVGYVC